MKQIFATFATALVFLTTNFLNAATWTWVGGSTTAWNNKANWSTTSPAAVPQTGDDVIINSGTNNPRLNASYTIRSLVMNAGSALDIRQRTLTVSTTITLNGGAFTNSNGTTTGIINANGAVTLNASNGFSIISPANLEFRINNTFTFTNGILYTNSNDRLRFMNGSSTSGASGNSHVDGPVFKLGNSAFTFPVGSGTLYAPFSMSAPTTTGTEYSAEYFPNAYVNTTSLAAGLDHISNVEYWIFNKITGTDVNVTLSFHTGRSGIVNSLTDLRVAKWNGTQWQSFGNGGTSGTTSNGTVTNSVAITSFSPFTLGSFSTLNPLPVYLLNFDASIVNHSANITWSTTSEVNSKDFTIEKSLDGKSWNAIATIASKGGQETINHYQITDNNLINGIQYYRIKQNDLNGSSNYFDKKSVNYSTIENTSKLYPNPMSDVLSIELNNDEPSNIVISNNIGQIVFESFENISSTLKIDVASFDAGIYTVTIETSKGIEVQKLIKK